MLLSIPVIVTVAVALFGGVGALLVHATYFGAKYGRMDKRIEDVENDVKGIKFDIDEVGKKLELSVKESFKYFVTQDSCHHINTTWKAEFKGLLNERNLWNKHNEEAHERTAKSLIALLSAVEVNQEKNDEGFDEVSDCLHKIQNDMKC